MEDIDAEKIQHAMRQVRSSLGNDVENLVQQARDATDWRCYVRRHPWFCMGAVAVAGYICVPRGKPTVSPFSPKEPSAGTADKAAVGTPGGIASAVAAVVIRSAVTTLAQHGLSLLKQLRRSDGSSVESPAVRSDSGTTTKEAEPW